MARPTDIVVKPRDVMPQGATTLPAALLRRRGLLRRARWTRSSAACGSVPGAPSRSNGRDNSSSASVLARKRHRHARRRQDACARSTTSAGIAARSSARSTTGTFAGSIQCPYHAWTYDLEGRLIGAPHMDEVPHFRKEEYPLHQRPRGRLGRPHLPQSRRATRSRSPAQLADLPAKFGRGRWRTSVSAAASSTTCKRELEADHPELQRVPALPESASGAQQAVALPERRERAAAARPTWAGGWICRPGVETLSMDGTCPRAIPARAFARGRHGASTTTAIFPNMLLSLHPDYMLMHTLWPLAPDRTINVCEWHFQPRELARPGFIASDCDRLLGHDEPAGLARLRAVAGGHLVARVHTGSVFQSRGPALRVRSDDRRGAQHAVALST